MDILMRFFCVENWIQSAKIVYSYEDEIAFLLKP